MSLKKCRIHYQFNLNHFKTVKSSLIIIYTLGKVYYYNDYDLHNDKNLLRVCKHLLLKSKEKPEKQCKNSIKNRKKKKRFVLFSLHL